MIVDLPETTVSGISKRLVLLRREGGATTLGRVLTLVIVAPSDRVEDAISAANVASREHPMRIIALAEPTAHAAAGSSAASRLDGQIRVGADAGAGDVIVLHPHGDAGRDPDQLLSGLLLADAPVVVWWAGEAPPRASETSLGRLAQRRVVDSGGVGDATARLRATSASYRPGDTDLAWSRLTLWRAQLAAALDNVPVGSERHDITGATVRGTPRSSSTLLLAAWLRLQLGVPVSQEEMPEQGPDADRRAWGIHSVEIHTSAGDIAIARTRGVFAAITQPGHPRLEVPLPRRSVSECLIEDLRLLRPDTLYGRVIAEGLPLLDCEFGEEH